MEKKNVRSPVSSSEQILEKSTKGATFLMMGQIFTKMITFVLNSLLIRFLSPRIFGISAFLEFIVGTALFFSREAIRLSTLRIKEQLDVEDSEAAAKERSSVFQIAANFAHITLWIGVPLSVFLITWQYRNINSYFVSLPYFTFSILLIWASIIIELLSEPFFIVNQFMLNYSVRSRFESISVTVGCVANFAVIVSYEKSLFHLPNDNSEVSKEGTAILAFAIGKLVHAISLLMCYYFDYLRNFSSEKMFKLRLTKIRAEDGKRSYYFQHDILEHFKKVYFQMCFKHLLTEGDKLIINSLCSVEEQGIYSLLSNYGSLITRLLFSPIEESLRLFLARLLSINNSKNVRLSMEVLVNLTKFYLYLSILILIFGPTNSPFLLHFLIGSKWSTTSVLDEIRVYCFYLPLLAMNGILEGFFQSIATGDQILKHSYFMMVFSGVFLMNCWILIEYLELSISGLIASNIINMLLRIGYCVWFINRFYRQVAIDSSFLVNFTDLKWVSLLGVVIWIIDWWLIGFTKNFQQFSVNIALAFSLLVVILLKERNSLRSLVGKSKLSSSKNI
ncbi:hypothetical protein HG535_0E03180 [Zygotorulaspora mrakii]|uniref:Man(5)GlcNAc(2)-PP-dolichol translocation protein RFT1 n=1 Tax=Zygotorulaspora mrakii TaxID=42260 RepID=A0A7H9B4E1_ZYGMR|nr:uncharacterized protein HG535_0E03180 [Zygotorulaspora mrakii]QLG73234.1 hypothetical protein HG535_0E03180 [Zygotorulaspora mrakii]